MPGPLFTPEDDRAASRAKVMIALAVADFAVFIAGLVMVFGGHCVIGGAMGNECTAGDRTAAIVGGIMIGSAVLLFPAMTVVHVLADRSRKKS